MTLIYFSFIFMGSLVFFEGMATTGTPDYCPFITSQVFKLSIQDLEDFQIKLVLYLNATEVENKTVGQFLDYLVNVERVSLSSHVASVRSLNPPDGVSPFGITPLRTPLCLAIDVFHNESNDIRQYTLFVGAKLTSQQALMRRFLKGLVLDNHTGLFKIGPQSPVILDKTSQPAEDSPTPSVEFNSQIVETGHTAESTKSSDLELFAEISLFATSGSTKYSKGESSTSKSSSKTRNAVASLLNKKKGLFVDESKLDLDPSFIKVLHDIVDNDKLPQLTRTERVVKLLNSYGWYVSNHFILGGRLDVIKSVSESGASDEKKELEALAVKLNTAFKAFGGSLDFASQKSSSSVNTNSYFSSNELVISTVDQAMDIASFMEKVTTEENWRIIKVKNSIPTCKFLLRKHSSLFAEIRRLIISNAHFQSIRDLQPNLDMLQYVNDLWKEYVQSF